MFRSEITSRTNGVTHICKKCFTHFTKQELFEKHISYCSANETCTVAVKSQQEIQYLNFKIITRNYQPQFVVYADFESFTKPLSSCEPYPHDSCTYSYQKHEPSGFCLYLKRLDGIKKLSNPIVYTKQSDNEGIAAIFVSKLKAITKKIYNDYYARNQNHSNLQNKNKRSLIKQSFAIFVRKNYMMMIQQVKC